MSRLELLAETPQVIVIRMHGNQAEGADNLQRGVVVYVPPNASRASVATQLRGAADRLDKR